MGWLSSKPWIDGGGLNKDESNKTQTIVVLVLYKKPLLLAAAVHDSHIKITDWVLCINKKDHCLSMALPYVQQPGKPFIWSDKLNDKLPRSDICFLI